jgi:nickel and cobalt resistance protein CnrR
LNRTTRTIAITIALAVSAGLLGGWLGGRYLGPHMHGEPALHAAVHHDLDLTPEQERRLEVIERRFAIRKQFLEAELRQANRELATAIAGSRRYGPEVQAAVDHFHRAMGELQKETIVHVFEMRGVLTPAQAEDFDRKVADALTEDAR